MRITARPKLLLHTNDPPSLYLVSMPFSPARNTLACGSRAKSQWAFVVTWTTCVWLPGTHFRHTWVLSGGLFVGIARPTSLATPKSSITGSELVDQTLGLESSRGPRSVAEPLVVSEN